MLGDSRIPETSYDIPAAKQLPFNVVYCSGQVIMGFPALNYSSHSRMYYLKRDFMLGFTKIRFCWILMQDEDYLATELNNGVLSRGWQSSRHVAYPSSEMPSPL